jgi:hypothetical protein
MSKWAVALGVAAAAATAAVVVHLALRRAAEQQDVPEIIADCYERIQRLEAEIHRLAPVSETAG